MYAGRLWMGMPRYGSCVALIYSELHRWLQRQRERSGYEYGQVGHELSVSQMTPGRLSKNSSTAGNILVAPIVYLQ
jgi:hypothetical protein